jgi:hypothetical protein
MAVVLVGGVAPASGASASSGLPTLTLGLNGKTVTVGGSTVSGPVNVVTTVTGDLNYLDPYGLVVFNASANKGTSSVQALLQPGNYLALDTQGNGNPPHTAFTVTQSASPAALPTPGATIKTIEFGFRGPTTLHEGELLRAENDGFLVHMDVFGQVKTWPRRGRSLPCCSPARTTRPGDC